MGIALPSDAYGVPLDEVQLVRYVIPAEDATVASATGILPSRTATGPCSLTLVAASNANDKLTITFPAAQADEAETAGLKVTLVAAEDDVLAVTADDTTGVIKIALAKSTAENNTATLIQAAIRAVTPTDGAEGVVKGIDVSDIICAAAGNWDSAAKAPAANMANVAFTGGGGEDIYPDVYPFLVQPSFPRNITAAITSSTGGDADIAPVSIVVYGTDINDQVLVETLGSFTENTEGSVAGNCAFKTITKIHLPSHDAAVPIMTIGYGEKIGIPKMFSVAPVYFTTLNGVKESQAATWAVDADEIAKNTIDLNSALNSTEVAVYMYL